MPDRRRWWRTLLIAVGLPFTLVGFEHSEGPVSIGGLLYVAGVLMVMAAVQSAANEGKRGNDRRSR